jgi:hypothetical protein
MTRNNLNSFVANGMIPGLAVFAMLCVSIQGASAQDIKLTLQDAPLTILKDSTVTKRINGIPSNSPGNLVFEIKWHVMSLIPNTFNMLKIELLHGSAVLQTTVCYSGHTDKTPRCGYWSFHVTETEADKSGDWKLRVSNNSQHDVNGFNIRKEATDLNPFVSSGIESYFVPDCSTKYLYLTGGGVAVSSHSTVEKVLSGVLTRPGEMRIRAKWHTQALTPQFHTLKVEVLQNGSVVKTDEGYSIHADQRGMQAKIDIRINVGANQAAGWKLRITNNGIMNITDFDIEKGSDLNPFVPTFRSTYKPTCN